MKYEISLPQWAIDANRELPARIESIEERMRHVIRFSRINFEQDTGGPFAAGIFEKKSGKVLLIAVNRVVPSQSSVAHAEIVAISIAQQKLKTFDLGGPDLPDHQIVVNARPCAMCFGAMPWSGIRSLVVGVSGSVIESLTGFDEGPIHPNWQSELRKRGIEVIEDILADEACEVLRDFGKSDRIVYNGRGGFSRD